MLLLDVCQCQESTIGGVGGGGGLRFPNIFGLNNPFSLSNIFRNQRQPNRPAIEGTHQQQQQQQQLGGVQQFTLGASGQLSPPVAGLNAFLKAPPPAPSLGPQPPPQPQPISIINPTISPISPLHSGECVCSSFFNLLNSVQQRQQQRQQ